MKKRITTFLALTALSFGTVSSVQAQDYDLAGGVTLSPDMGLNVKKFVGYKGAIEAQLAYYIPGDGVMLSAVYQYHIPLAEGFNLYAGGGLNIGALYLGKFQNGEFALGIDPTVGFEYTFASAPIALAIDYKPNINFTTDSQFDLVAFKIRYIFR